MVLSDWSNYKDRLGLPKKMAKVVSYYIIRLVSSRKVKGTQYQYAEYCTKG
jgi:hypothetical protein